jgi:hypothetical protein
VGVDCSLIGPDPPPNELKVHRGHERLRFVSTASRTVTGAMAPSGGRVVICRDMASCPRPRIVLLVITSPSEERFGCCLHWSSHSPLYSDELLATRDTQLAVDPYDQFSDPGESGKAALSPCATFVARRHPRLWRSCLRFSPSYIAFHTTGWALFPPGSQAAWRGPVRVGFGRAAS